MGEDHRQSVSVAGVVVDDQGRALVIQRRDNGRWEAPGGVLEHGETIQEGLRREVLEETGLVVELEALTGVYQNLPLQVVALVFRCRATGGELTVNDEVTAFRWLTADEVRPLLTEAFAVRVTDALSRAGDAGPAVRPHDGTRLI
ncbi:MAG TPA: NUDIX domain-containing protein [Acidimicrobiales bacterium]